MFNKKSFYALTKNKNSAIVYIDANDAIICITRKDLANEGEFLKCKDWSDGSHHIENKNDVVAGKRLAAIDDLVDVFYLARAPPGFELLFNETQNFGGLSWQRKQMAANFGFAVRMKNWWPNLHNI